MAITINWGTKVITVPQNYLSVVSAGIYQLNVDAFRLSLKALEASPDGLSFQDTHRHNTQVLLSGVTYSRIFEIINGYTITFEDVGTPYTVVCVGANHNIADVKTVNNVSLIIGNSAGLITVTSGSGLSVEQNKMLTDIAKLDGLVDGVPLVVDKDNDTRTAGDITQTVITSGNVTTVTRV